MKKAVLPIILVLVAGAMVAIFAIGNRHSAKPKDDAKRSGQQFADQGQDHIEEGEKHEPYNSNPPTSGPHYGAPTPWGVKDNEIVDETLIHNLEHGGVVIAYKPDIDPKILTQLKNLFRELPPSQQFNSVKAVLVPRSKNEHKISVTAWTYALHLDELDGAKIRQFYLDHLDKGPELVP